MSIEADFDEAKQSQLPFAEMLVNMGYRYIPQSETKTLRNGDLSQVILRPVAEQFLMNINSYEKNGEQVKFTPAEVSGAIDELEKTELNQHGLINESKEKYRMLMSKTSGTSVDIGGSGKEKSQDFVFVDFDNLENNDFAFTVEYEILGNDLKKNRPDIVIFVNGIPFSVIENKKSSVDIDDAIKQLGTRQRTENIPQLFVYPQLLVAANTTGFKYGTTGTPLKFYAKWREKDFGQVSGYLQSDNDILSIIEKEIDSELYQQILRDLNGKTQSHTQITERSLTDQDRGVYFLFEKKRMLDMVANFVLFDGAVKIIMRYQQYFGIKKIFERIHTFEENLVTGEQRRRGGVIWHTQGSGKSLTMVNLAKEIIEDERIENPRIIIVTDRRDLDVQIRDTFKTAGLKKEVYQAKSGQDLISKIQKKDSRIITTLVQKFDTAGKGTPNFCDSDDNIFVLIDEAHRSQKGEASMRMDKIIPNACYLAFTGTPLLRDSKTVKRFGNFIDKYTIDDALADNVILPLFYIGSYAKLEFDKEKVDRYIERITEGETPENKQKIQKKIQSQVIKDNPQRIGEIVYDIQKHFSEKFQGTGLKAQVVAPSQYSAILMQQYFEQEGSIQTAVVLSGSEEDENNNHKTHVAQYMKKLSEKFGSQYETNMIESFKKDDNGVEIIIVVDKLLTGFDAPRNTVLYLVKELRDHNLLQAIARVNRLYENKKSEFPKTAGYVIDYSENAENLGNAMKLFGNVQDTKDIEHSLFDMKDKIAQLERSYDELFEVFKEIENKNDSNEYIELLNGEEKEKERKDFYNKFNEFKKNFSEAVVFRDFINQFEHYDMYALDLKKMMNIKRTLAYTNADEVDFSKYKNAITDVLDKYVTAEEVERLTAEINISHFAQDVSKNLDNDKARAEAMAAQMKKTINDKMESDPEFFKKFSEKIEKIIADMHAKKMKDLDAFGELQDVEKEMNAKTDNSLPTEIVNIHNAGLFYRNLKADFQAYEVSGDNYEKAIVALATLVNKSIIVNFHNNIDSLRRLKSEIDDYIYEELGITDIEFSKSIQDKIVDELLLKNIDMFTK